jgi:hypothetical protein
MNNVIDLAESDDDMIKRQATDAVARGDFNNWDHAYESLWAAFEFQLSEAE